MVKCHYCKKEIDENNGTHCALISYNDGDITNQDCWHSECWKIEWQEKMDNKIKEYSNKMLKTAEPLIASKFGGGLGLFR
jgi:hypothetical protein